MPEPSRPPSPASERAVAPAWSPVARGAGIAGLAAGLALAAALAVRPLAHDDLFGHLQTGAWIARHHAVPRADPFSFTRFGAPWVAHEWGFSLLAYAVFRLAGFAGLKALAALVMVAILAAVVLRTAVAIDGDGDGERKPPRALPLAATLAGLAGLGLWTVAAEVFLRAALVGELMLALALLGLTVYSRRGDRRALGCVVAVFFLWGNLHSGVVFGLFVLALYALEPLAARLVLPRWPRLAPLFPRRAAAPYLWTFAGALAASLANPNGVATLLYPFRLSRILFGSGIEWNLGHFATVSPARNPRFLLLAALLVVALLPSRGARLPFAELAAVATFCGLALWIPRLVFDFVVVALPPLGQLLLLRRDSDGSAAERAAPAASGRRRREVLAVAVATVLCLAAIRAWAGFTPRPVSRELPTAGVRFLAAHGIRGRIFNHQNFGGTIGWSLGVPIFWDGRNDVFAGLVREVSATPFAETAARYGVDHLLLAENEYRDLLPELATGRWGLVYWDDDCAIYLRRGPRFAPLLGNFELTRFPPFGGRPGLSEAARDPRAAAGLRHDLDQVLAANSDNQRALYFQGVVSLYQKDLPRARRELAAAARLGSNDQVALALARLAELERASR